MIDGSAARPAWASGDPVLETYYDTEWGVVVTDESSLFEMLSLEVFVVGLAWRTILRKRGALRSAFDRFEVDAVAAYDTADLDRLLNDAQIIRNERKIRAVVGNARAAVQLRADGGLAELIWAHQPAVTPAPLSEDEIPRTSAESVRLAETLRSRGFAMIGPVTAHSLMAAVGVVDLHVVGDPLRHRSGLWSKNGRRRRRPQLEGNKGPG